MQQPRVLIVYGSGHGHTALISLRIAEVMERLGCVVMAVRGDKLPRSLVLEHFDAIVVGASVEFGRHQRYIERFVERNRDYLQRVPSAFFSVCGASGRPDARNHAVGAGYIQRFITRTGWAPRHSVSFGGALSYTKYPPLLRWLMKRIAASSGRSTDTSRDHIDTDWSQVERFATSCALMAERAEPAAVRAVPV